MEFLAFLFAIYLFFVVIGRRDVASAYAEGLYLGCTWLLALIALIILLAFLSGCNGRPGGQ